MSPARRADIAFFTAIAFGILFIAFGGPLGRRLEMVHMNDFSGFWSGPALYLQGVYPWDPARYSDMAIGIGTKAPDALVYDYFPWVMFFLMPLALVPLEVAGWIWMVASMTAATFALRALLRTYVPGMTAVHGALGLALTVFFLWLAFRHTHWADLARDIRSANIPLALLAVAVVTLIFPLRARRWPRT